MADYEQMTDRELEELSTERFGNPKPTIPASIYRVEPGWVSVGSNRGFVWIPKLAYATNPAASAQLRDKMRELGWLDTTQRMRSIPGMTRAEMTRAEFWKEDGCIESVGQCLHPVDERARLTAALRALDTEAGRG